MQPQNSPLLPTGSPPVAPGPPGDGSAGRTDADEAGALFAELRSRAPRSRCLAIESDPRFTHRGLAERLIAEAREAVFDDPERAIGLAALSVAVGERLLAAPTADAADTPGHLSSTRELLSRAHAYLANAHRVAGDPYAAETAFHHARRHLAESGGDRCRTARIDELEASLLKDQERFAEAHELLDAALEVYREERQDRLLGRAVVKRGHFLIFEGRYTAALRATLEALPLLRPEEDPRTFNIAVHNAVNCLNRTGYSIAARSLLDDVRQLYERLGNSLGLLRVEWMAAEIDRELGMQERAERGLREVREQLIARGLAYDAALASLQLAELYASDDGGQDPLKMQQLAVEMLPIFQSRSLHRSALAALILFREAIASRRADLELIGELTTFLRSSRRNRGLHFRPSF